AFGSHLSRALPTGNRSDSESTPRMMIRSSSVSRPHLNSKSRNALAPSRMSRRPSKTSHATSTSLPTSGGFTGRVYCISHQAHQREDASAQFVEVLAFAPARQRIPKRACDRVLQAVLGCALQGTAYPFSDLLRLTRL